MKLLKDKKLAIVGGGPSGLTLARLLQMRGAEVKVYERDTNSEARDQGATLDLHEESGLKALQQAGLMAAFEANYRPGADRLRLLNHNADILLDDHASKNHHTSRPEIDRGPLKKLLLDSLKPDTVIWDSHFTSLTPQNEGWLIHFKNGITAYADLIVAADGANSKLRPYVTAIQPFYSGITVVEGKVYNSAVASPRMHKLLKEGKIFAFGNEQSIIVSSKGDGSLVFYTGCKTPEHWVKESKIDFANKAQVITWFQQEYVGWDALWLELFENANLPFVPRPQYCTPFDQTWATSPNITLMGDAAHLMPPYAGEGVNMAMQDALELSECLNDSSFNSLTEAISAYEVQMRVRASASAAITMESTAALHSLQAIAYLMNVLDGN